ncbi:zinc finger protein 449 isoform X1 [Lingula anatina]|uniref:Zinc finger protein 449 isoform X1 n=1 Tax=Lingula anatina TaxID=7574 RepID=A0A1S3IXQ3_LINAN|nr:zinc finger protein 449 isoform X1 [Lingula anatina]XP_013402757.1 zinc finger protein 449 isoform X1 [Lingula anatina]|eukprot:XP_013402756.1 zinc finger protein 449 isoform X1 [Lingula anatina]
MLKVSRIDINLPTDLVQTCAGVREKQLCKFIATNSSGEFQHSIEVRGKQNNMISLELTNLKISFKDGKFVAEIEQALKVFHGEEEVEGATVVREETSNSQGVQLQNEATLPGWYDGTSQENSPNPSSEPESTSNSLNPFPKRLFQNTARKRSVTATVTTSCASTQQESLSKKSRTGAPGICNPVYDSSTGPANTDKNLAEQTLEAVSEGLEDILEVKVEPDPDLDVRLKSSSEGNTPVLVNSTLHPPPPSSQSAPSLSPNQCQLKRRPVPQRLSGHSVTHTAGNLSMVGTALQDTGHQLDPGEFQVPAGSHRTKLPDQFSRSTLHQKAISKSWPCPICKSTFATKYSLNNHMDIHEAGNGERYRCDKCGTSYALKRYLTEHLKRKHQPPSYRCRKCGELFRWRRCKIVHETSCKPVESQPPMF